MTQIYSVDFNGVNYSVLGESWETRNSWGHTAYLLRNGDEISRARVRYYNRTWESYRYQSAGLQAVDVARDAAVARALEDYRERTGKKRLSADEKKQILENDAAVRVYDSILQGLETQRRYC